MKTPTSVQAVILTGSRSSHSSILRGFECSTKAMLPLLGQPLLMHVLSALRGADYNLPISISGDCMQTGMFAEREGLTYIASGFCAVDSIRKAMEHLPLADQVFFISGDHPLLTPAMVNYFMQEILRKQLTLAFAFVPKRIVTEKYPHSRRTYVPFKGESYSGGNLIFIDRRSFRGNQAHLGAFERYRKTPWFYPFLFNPLTMVRLLLRRLDLQQASAMISRKLGYTVGAIEMPFAECAMDVDSTSDLVLAEQVLRQRFQSQGLGFKRGDRRTVHA